MNDQEVTTTTTTSNTATKGEASSANTSSSSPVIVATPSTISIDPEDEKAMETAREESSAADPRRSQEKEHSTPDAETASSPRQKTLKSKDKGTEKHDKKGKGNIKKSKKSKRVKVESSSDESSSDDSSSSSSDDDSSDSDSNEDERERRKKVKSMRKRAAKKKADKKKAKLKAKKRKSKKYGSSSDESDSDSSDSSSSSSSSDSDSSDSEDDKKRRKKRAPKKAKKSKKGKDDSSSDSSSEEKEESKDPILEQSVADMTSEEIQTQLDKAKAEAAALQVALLQRAALITPPAPVPSRESEMKTAKKSRRSRNSRKSKKGKMEYNRVDQVWDSKTYDWRIRESTAEETDDFDSVFTVRRKFTWDNKFDCTTVDVKSALLQKALKEILKDVKGQSLEEETPSIDPNLLFLHYDEIKTYYKKTLKTQLKKQRKRKPKQRLTKQRAQCKLLLDYLDNDYAKARKRLVPMLKAGDITFDLIWALFKPNTIIYTPTYGNQDDPRCFKVDSIYKYSGFMGEEYWTMYGRYLEYDGKKFGLGDHIVKIESFKGSQKITSLAAYPLSYHKDPEGLKEQLIERGKKFVALQGMNYRYHKGIGYQKKKKSVAKVNVDGRVMVDPAIFRRINPNYPLTYIKHKQDEDDHGCGCGDSDSGSDAGDDSDEENTRVVVWKDNKGKAHLINIPEDADGPDISSQKLETIEAEGGSRHSFTEEELLIASPVVLGFAFSEKYWLEFSLSGITEIEWNSEAFDTLVLAQHVKRNLKGLVSSHRFNGAKTIDDVIQGKGKGLNVVLHGAPGVGKTLTAESIADYLKCPLYAVSAGELGTNSHQLEEDLQKIMDITHSWGAILLLDEADVFLEQRQAQDVHRNALVSVFLRLLEYYQGILFLTTNRVETFDEAFQSRIHMGIPYENLTAKARREIWQQRINTIAKMKDQKSDTFKSADLDELCKKVLNGRQIKNTVAVAQSIALAENEPFSMQILKRVLDVGEDFDADMKGGRGYRDAMRHYT